MGKKGGGKDEVVKLVVVGAGGVGKSSLTLQFMYGDFREDYDPTQVDSYRKKVQYNGQETLLDILDTAGQEEYAAMRDQYYRTGEGFMVVFALNMRDTFDEVESFFDGVKRVMDTEVPFILVGNKCDLEDQRVVSREDCSSLASKMDVKFFETSAKTNSNVAEAFMELTDLTIKAKLAQSGDSSNKKKSKGGCLIF